MSTIQVANVDLDSSSNTQFIRSANTITLRVGGANAFTVNSTSINFLLPVTSTSFPPTQVTIVGNTVANTLSITGNGSVFFSGQINLNGNVTPATINSSISAFSPPIANTTLIRFSANSSNNSALSIYGMTAGTNGQIVILSNIGTKAVTIESESVSEATAGNKFRLPSNMLLNGYQSTTFYYVGASDPNDGRWIPTDFDQNELYKQFLTGASFSGGVNNAVVSTSCRINYATEATSAAPGANLSQARSRVSAAGNACKGFFAGGTDAISSIYATADRTTFASTTTAAVPGANLTQARHFLSAGGNSCKAIFFNGIIANTDSFGQTTTTTDRTTYSTETTAVIPGAFSANLASMGVTGNACKAILTGGGRGPTCTISRVTYRFTYATETATSIACNRASLVCERYGLAAAGNACKGFFAGGTGGFLGLVPYTTADRFTYSTEILTAVPGAYLTQARNGLAAAGNNCKGFFAGGSPSSSGSALATANRTTYASETTAAVTGANLTQARQHLAAV